MNITQENKANLTATLKIQLAKDDYQEKVDKALKEMQKKAQMPGFRTGKVPMGIVKKLYGKSVLAEEINKVLVDGMYEYIKEKDLKILGNPLPDHDNTPEIDWENQSDFEFHYQVGIAPEINIQLDNYVEVEYLDIKIEDSMIDEALNDLKRKFGNLVNPELVEKNDVVYGEFRQLDDAGTVVEGGLTNKSNLFVQYLKDEATKNSFVGKKIGESIDLDLTKSVENESEIANMLGINKDKISDYGSNYRFTIEKISRIEPAELNEEFYTKAAAGKNITTEEGIRAFIKEQLQEQYRRDSDKHFRNEAIKSIVEKAAVELPEEFLKRWLWETNNESKNISAEDIEKEFTSSKNAFKWQLIENVIVSNHKMEVTNEEVDAYLRDYIRIQLMQYGQDSPAAELIDSFVQRIVGNKEEVKKVYDKLYEAKITDLLKTKLKVVINEVTFQEFLDNMMLHYSGKTN